MYLKQVLPLLLLYCLFFSCAEQKAIPTSTITASTQNTSTLNATNTNIRMPTSLESEENFDKQFDVLISSEDPEKEFSDYLNRLKNIFIRAEASVADFDGELDKSITNATPISFEDSKSYKKLLIMFSLKNRLKDKIIFFYLKLTDLAYDKSFDVVKKHKMKQLLHNFKKKLESTIPLEKITYDELKHEIAIAIIERRGIDPKSFSSTETPENSFKDDNEKLQILRQNRDNFLAMGKAEQGVNDDLGQKIDEDADSLKFIDKDGRTPQSDLTYFPSTGTNGNIMGKVFPKNTWALTYDDGPNPIHTPVVLKNLEDLGIKATFFWLAQNVIRYQSIVDMVKDKGMARENHSWSHPQLPKLSQDGLNKEIIQSTQVESKAYGETIKFFRCPYGAGVSVPHIRQMIADLGMIHVFWNVDTLDWQDKDPDSIVARAQKQMRLNGHGVILFHDIHPQSVIASKKLVEWSKTLKGSDNEIRWVTIPEIVSELNGIKK